MSEVPPLTREQILGLAPDHATAKAGRGLVAREKWAMLGRSGSLIWGEISLTNRPPQRIHIDLDGPHFHCNCRTRKIPCRHAVGLALLWARQRSAFVRRRRPNWVEPRPRRAEGSVAEERETRKLNLMRDGMAELALWLKDLFHGGLATVEQRPKASWERITNRLIDAQAGQVALDLGRLAAMPGQRPGWPEPFLRLSGRLYLLTQAFARYERLDREAQGDLRAAAGWLPRRPDPDGALPASGRWQVVGRRTEQIGRQYLYRTWLWGQEENRAALLTQATHDRRGGSPILPTGSVLEDGLVFAPSRYPLLAVYLGHGETATVESGAGGEYGHEQVEAALADYAAALTANPWLRIFPFYLRRVRPESGPGGWHVVDETGRLLQLPANHPQRFHLLAVTGGHPIDLFGEWNGAEYYPVSLRRDGRWIDLHALGGSG